MKVWTLVTALLIAAPSLAFADDGPSERAKAERQRTIQKQKARKAAAKAAADRRKAVARQPAAVPPGTGLLEAAAINRANQNAPIGQSNGALNVGSGVAYRTNPFYVPNSGFGYGGGGYNYNYGVNPALVPGLGMAQAYGANSILGVPVNPIVPGLPGVSVLGDVPGVSAHPAKPNPVTTNK